MSGITNQELESQWHGKLVEVPACPEYPRLKPGKYLVTAAFWETESEIVFALMDENYSKENPNWIAFHVSENEWRGLVSKLKIIGDRDYMLIMKDVFGWRGV